MRKLLIVFVILLILGGLGFFFGWAQFAVPPGSVGVMRSKTFGVDQEPITEGEFRWVWYKLIPTNVEILVFKPQRTEESLEVSGSLPQADLYRSFSGVNADFSYALRGTVGFSIKTSALPDLVRRGIISSQSDLDSYQASRTRELRSLLDSYFSSPEKSNKELEALLGSGRDEALKVLIEGAFPDLDNLSCHIDSVKTPDLAIYGVTKELYADYITRQREILSQGVKTSAEDHLGTQLRFDELAKYGELLTKYPVLLQYLAIERGADGIRAPDAEAGTGQE